MIQNGTEKLPDDRFVAVAARGRGADSTCTVRCCCRMCSGMRDTRALVPPIFPDGAYGADSTDADADTMVSAEYEGFGGR